MDHNLVERQINLPMVEPQQNGLNGNGYEKQFAFSNGLNMANRDPIDLQFKDITYTVKLGFNKGKFQFTFNFIYLRFFFSLNYRNFFLSNTGICFFSVPSTEWSTLFLSS